MKKSIINMCSAVLLGISLSGCDGWLGDVKPSDFLTESQVWNDNSMVLSTLANAYNQVPNNGSVEGDANLSLFDDLMWCGLMNQDVENARNQMTAYGYSNFRYYDYAYIYRLNQAIEALANNSSLTNKNIFSAEFRFMRAYAYFQMCIRMGGVPLVTRTSQYTPGMDITTLQVARATEAETYNFVYDECMAIKDVLAANNNVTNHSRANKYAALALASRAMLYAGSIAKYNAAMATPITSTTQAGVVGMTGENATSYYQKALAAAKEIIDDGVFKLQGVNSPSADAFYNAICVKDGNTEVIWCKDFNASKFHNFTFANIAQSMNEDNDNGSDLCPTLQLIENYEMQDGTVGGLKDKDGLGNYIAYSNIGDIFEGRDYRLKGTCIVPGQVFRGKALDVQAGVAVYQGGTYTLINGAEANSRYTPADDHPQADGGTFVGNDGPLNRANYTNTGFNLRKFVDQTVGSSARGQGSYMWWPYFRMGEIYLNAAEAAMELGQSSDALAYVNKVRQRGGVKDWTAADLTIDNMLKERRRELVCEDSRLWDMKRLRVADQVWNGVQSTSTMLYALYPYRVIGGPNAGKYIFDRKVAPRFKAPRNFRLGNYYTSFSQDALNKNPKLVQNPNY